MKCWIAWVVAGWMALTVASARGVAARPNLRLTFDENREPGGEGLVAPSGGDGTHEFVSVNGTLARRLVGEQARYFYVRIVHPDWTNRHEPVQAWVVFEVFDDRIASVALQYDRAASIAAPADPYARTENRWLTGSRQWRRLVFELPNLSLRGGQNLRAAFRLCAPGIAVRAVELRSTPPPDAHTRPTPPFRASRQPGMELTLGNDAGHDDAVMYRALSVTSVESYVDWAGVEPESNRWDWSRWNAQIAVLESAGLRWVPFLIAGPAYATPLWFHQSSASRYYRCLEHDQDSRVQSHFNPQWPAQVDRFLAAFAAQYRDRAPIESLLLGITGIYGESIYPAGPEGGWTARLTGRYHNHHGWWAGDADAIAAFRDALRTRYADLRTLNRAWGTSLKSFDEVRTFLPDRAPNDRARADFVEWYQQAMTDWCVMWARIVRRHFPQIPVYLCTGGDGDPVLGADFTAQAKAMAPFGIGIRITNEGSDYPQNFTLTREVATATRLYRTFCGFEPAGNVSRNGNIARIYNATASGARQLHAYADNITREPQALELFAEWVRWLTPRTPQVELALYLPRETWALDPAANRRLREIARELRDVADHDFLTRLSVADGHLRHYRVLLVADAEVIEPAAADAMERWVIDGGLLVVATRANQPVGSRLYDLSAWRDRLLAPVSQPPAAWLIPRLDGPVPPHWELDVGSDDDEPWLAGEWHGREARGTAHCRWTGARAILLVPAEPHVRARLTLELHVPRPALRSGAVQISVDSLTVGTVTSAGSQVVEFEVPAPLATGRLARIAITCRSWKPSEVSDSTDTRSLGVEVYGVRWRRADVSPHSAPVREARICSDVDPGALTLATRRVSQGRTVHLPGLASQARDLARIIAHLLPNLPDGRLDRRYATRTAEGVLWCDPDTPRIWIESPSPQAPR